MTVEEKKTARPSPTLCDSVSQRLVQPWWKAQRESVQSLGNGKESLEPVMLSSSFVFVEVRRGVPAASALVQRALLARKCPLPAEVRAVAVARARGRARLGSGGGSTAQCALGSAFWGLGSEGKCVLGAGKCTGKCVGKPSWEARRWEVRCWEVHWEARRSALGSTALGRWEERCECVLGPGKCTGKCTYVWTAISRIAISYRR